MDFNGINEILTVEEVCDILRIGKNSAYNLINSGEIKCYLYNRIWKIPRISVDEYMERMRNNYFKH